MAVTKILEQEIKDSELSLSLQTKNRSTKEILK